MSSEHLQQALNRILELEGPNMEGWETEIHRTAREALGISEEEYFENKKFSQVAGTTSEDRKTKGITIQVSDSMLSPLYENISIVKAIIEFSNDKGWSKEQLLLASKIIQSLEHFS